VGVRANHAAWLERLAWSAIAVGGGVLVVASFLPAFELAIGAGLGRSARSFRYVSEVAFADLRPLGLVPLVAGLLLVAAGAYALLRRPPWWLAVGSLVVALGLAWFAIDTYDRLLSSDVIGYAERGAGPLLQPGLDELEADARQSPEARDPSWTVFGSEDDYDYSRGLAGWTILAATTQMLVWLTGYRVLRQSLAPLPTFAVVAVATLVFWVWLFFRALGRTA
jgi:hypothetical protein